MKRILKFSVLLILILGLILGLSTPNKVEAAVKETVEASPSYVSENIPAQQFGLEAPEEYYILGRPMTNEEKAVQYELMERFNNRYIPSEGEETAISVTSDPDFNMTLRSGVADRKYDPRAGVTSVKDQTPYGTCWSFATMNMVENSLVRNNGYSSDSTDFSERHLTYFCYFNQPDPLGGTANDKIVLKYNYKDLLDAGGNISCALRIGANWMGAAEETTAPYGGLPATLNNTLAYTANRAYITGFYQFHKSDMQVIKQSILEHGSVGMSYFADSSKKYYNASTAAYYYNTERLSNHAVSIVGWDDDFSMDAFATKPEDDGAWIVKNSWGSDWGDGGYFYLSYYDKSIDASMYAVEASPATKYDNNYQYDMSYFTAGLTANSRDMSGANIFKAQAKAGGIETIKAVAFECKTTMTNYSVQIYTKLTDLSDPTSGQAMLPVEAKGTTAAAGYYTVDIPSGIKIETGDYFSVVVNYTKASDSVSIPVEARGSLAGFATCQPAGAEKQGYVKNQGDVAWTDVTTITNASVRIKVFTKNEAGSTVPVKSIAISGDKTGVVKVGEKKQLQAAVQPSNATNKIISWNSSDTKTAMVDSNGMLIGVAPGTAKITARSVNGGYTDIYTVTVTAVNVTTLTLSASEFTMDMVGNTVQIDASMGDLTAKDVSVTWKSSDESVILAEKMVPPKGKVSSVRIMAVGPGSAILTAKSDTNPSQTAKVTIKVSDHSFNQVRAFVCRMYINVLNRKPDPNGLYDWSNYLLNKTVDGSGTAEGFVFSKEFEKRMVSNDQYVTMLYQTFLNRNPDEPGKSEWIYLLNGGMSRRYVLSGFVNSAEFQQICNQYGINRGTLINTLYMDRNPGITMFIHRLYDKALQRKGEEQGVEEWAERLVNATYSPETVVKFFIQSSEFVNRRHSDMEYIKILYRTFLDREAEKQGLDFWNSQIKQGMSREKVLEGFSRSSEFEIIISKYGL